MLSIFKNVKRFILLHPYLVIFLFLMYIFGIFLLSSYSLRWFADNEVYIAVSQVLHHGGVLYRDSIDTKNIGFLLFFYNIIYLPYVSIFPTLNYFMLWQGIFLMTWYYLLAVIVYNTLKNIYSKQLSLLSVIIMIVFMAHSDHSFFINQPQIALIFPLLLLYHLTIYTKNTTYLSYCSYFLYGILLGCSFAFSTPYAVLVLFIPMIAFQQYLQDKIFFSIIKRGVVSFLGFLLALSPYISYLYKNNSFIEWWDWNVNFATTTYTESTQTHFFIKLLQGLYSTLFAFTHISLPAYMDIIFCQSIIYITLIILSMIFYNKFFEKNHFVIFRQEKYFIMFGILTFLSRLMLVRESTSYNLYIIPMIILLFPMIYRFIQHTNFIGMFQKWIIIGITISILLVPLRFLLLKRNRLYSPEIKSIVQLNPDKEPITIIFSWSGYSYSSKWKVLYYNLYGWKFYDEKYAALFYTKKYKPEVILIRMLTIQHEYMKQNYVQVAKDDYSMLWIRKDKVHTWVLPK